jgi:hypothetical protein
MLAWSFVRRPSLWACLPAFWLAQGWASVQLRCEVTYAGASQQVVVEPVQDAYAAQSVDVRGRFRFKAVMVGVGDRVERIGLYVYQNTPGQPVLIQNARYLPPFQWPVDGSPLVLTGQQHLYAGPMERELIYGCTLHRRSS